MPATAGLEAKQHSRWHGGGVSTDPPVVLTLGKERLKLSK